MLTHFFILAAAILPSLVHAQSVVTETDYPGTRNTSVVYYDDGFLFLARSYGDHRDFHGNTEPGLFVHSKDHDLWLRILQVSTKDATLSRSHSDNPKESQQLMMSSVSWDFTAYTNKAWIALPLKTSGSIAFPDKIEFDAASDRYRLSFFTSWKIQSVETILYINRKDLSEQFSRLEKP